MCIFRELATVIYTDFFKKILVANRVRQTNMHAMQRFFSLLFVFSSWASAQLHFDELTKEFVAHPDDAKLTCDFPFENKGTTVQEIVAYVGNCSCISAQLSNDGQRVYQPGEKGVVRAIFDLGTLVGTFEKQVVVTMKGDPANQPSITLQAKIQIPEFVKLEPKTIQWLVDEVKSPKIIKVTMHDDKPINISAVTSSNPNFEVSQKEVVAGKEYEISVVPTAKAQNILGITVIRVETDCSVGKQKSQMAFATIRRAPPTGLDPKHEKVRLK
jgi:hypothetical protein